MMNRVGFGNPIASPKTKKRKVFFLNNNNNNKRTEEKKRTVLKNNGFHNKNTNFTPSKKVE